MFFSKLLVATLTLSSVDGRIYKPEHRDLEASAKFTAAWTNETEVAGDCLNVGTDTIWGMSEYVEYCDSITVNQADVVLEQTSDLGLLKIPQGKEILATLSAEINLFTLNTATSETKGGPNKEENTGNIGVTKTMAGVDVELVAISDTTEEDFTCAPGKITMASRFVELRNQITANITYEDCIYDGKTCVTKIADHEIESSIGLAMGTTAAHSFQWVCADLPADTYRIAARFSISAEAQDLCVNIEGDNCADIDDLAIARVILQKRILTAQEVRAVKDALDGM